MADSITVDRRGITLADASAGTYDVLFDGDAIWSFVVDEPGPTQVPWPPNMRRWLKGVAGLSLKHGDVVHEIGEVRFGKSPERIRFVDQSGVRVVIDKWGIIQRPFKYRGEGVVADMVSRADQIIEILRDECGVQAWMGFGTLLGAVRNKGVITHDADIDLAYLSVEETPARMMREMFGIRRALSRHGFNVINKNGSFITVTFTASDGSLASIDLYTCFYLGELLYESATVRAKVPRTAIEPVQQLEFEGAMLPAPADADAMLAASYGVNWRTPDPSFRHAPGPDVVHRFDDWFGSVMKQRRPWEVFWRDTAPNADLEVSSFAGWTARRLEPGSAVVDVGTGDGRDAAFLAEHAAQVVGLDYARGAVGAAARQAREAGHPLTFDHVNFYDVRDALTSAALLRRTLGAPGTAQRVLYARSTIDALPPDALATFWRFADVLLRGGGRAFLEFEELLDAPGEGPAPRFHGTGGARYAVRPEEVAAAAARFGARIVRRVAGDRSEDPERRTWRFELAWER